MPIILLENLRKFSCEIILCPRPCLVLITRTFYRMAEMNKSAHSCRPAVHYFIPFIGLGQRI